MHQMPQAGGHVGHRKKANASFAGIAKHRHTPHESGVSKKEAPVAKNNIIDTERLENKPVIVPGVDIGLPEKEVVALWINGQMRKSLGTTMWLELSFETELQAMAIRTASELMKSSKPMMTIITKTANLLGTADRLHCGLSLPGHKTGKQHHAPLGVLHMDSGQIC